jgi:hypothetical protein
VVTELFVFEDQDQKQIKCRSTASRLKPVLQLARMSSVGAGLLANAVDHPLWWSVVGGLVGAWNMRAAIGSLLCDSCPSIRLHLPAQH